MSHVLVESDILARFRATRQASTAQVVQTWYDETYIMLAVTAEPILPHHCGQSEGERKPLK